MATKVLLTTYEASKKYDISTRHLRHLLEVKGALKGERAKISESKEIWLIKDSSIRAYLRNRPKPGPKPKRKRC